MAKYGNAVIPQQNLAHFDAIIAGMPVLVETIVEKLEEGMRTRIIPTYESVILTEAYEDDTTATRNSTNVVVFRSSEYPPQEFAASRAIAEQWRPGSADPDTGGPPPPQHTIVLEAYCATIYSEWLNIRYGGESMFLWNAIAGNADAALTAATGAASDVFV